ncbi:mucin-5AC isoform X2 [Lingula anatina]|nr:mucin-5AC isoform X2 [Lingula anatina]|eukprot:XP_013403808.1 mucin-5AC isoform X2 [Lingula anatina]
MAALTMESVKVVFWLIFWSSVPAVIAQQFVCYTTSSCEVEVDTQNSKIFGGVYSVRECCQEHNGTGWRALLEMNTCGSCKDPCATCKIPPKMQDPPDDTTVACNNIPEAPLGITGLETCSPITKAGYQDLPTVIFQCSYTLRRQFFSYDECNAKGYAVQEIVVTAAPPIVTAPSAAQISVCPGYVIEADKTGTPIVQTCDVIANNFTVDYSDLVTSEDVTNCTKTIRRLWSVEDECGAVVEANQTIFVDVPPLTINAPPVANITACLDDSIYVNQTGTPVVQSCAEIEDALKIEYQDAVVNTQTCHKTVQRTWTVSDQCGSSVTADQKIVVTIPAPNVQPPGAAEVAACPGEVIGTAKTGQPIIQSCQSSTGTIHIEHNDTVISENSTNCRKTLQRRWTVSDGCGALITTDQTIVVNPVAPELEAPNDTEITVCRGESLDGYDTGKPEVLSCSKNITVVHMDKVVKEDDATCRRTIQRTWLASDECGYEVEGEQLILVNPALPTITAPLDTEITICRDEDLHSKETGTPTFQSCNANATLSTNYTDFVISHNNQTCQKTVRRQWMVTDECGSSVTDDQLITVNHKPPTVLVPVDAEITTCDGDVIGTEVTGSPTVLSCNSDTSNITVDYEDTVMSKNNQTCQRKIQRRWTVIDECGSTVVVDQIIFVNVQPPTVVPPADSDVTACPGESIGTSRTGRPTIRSCHLDANNATMDYVDTILSEETDTCQKTIQRRWSVVDDCGSNVSMDQIITVLPAPPSVAPPTDIQVAACDDDVIDTDRSGVPSVHSCNPNATNTVNFVDSVISENNQTCQRTIQRQWTTTDECGVSASAYQNIIIKPVLPSIIAPADTEIVICPGEVIDVSKTGEPTVVPCSSMAGDPVTDYTDTVVSENTTACLKTIQRWWTVSDGCGQSAHADQLIRVTELKAPEITINDVVQARCENLAELRPMYNPTMTQSCFTDLLMVQSILTEITPEDIFDGPCEEISFQRKWKLDNNHCSNQSSVVRQVVQVLPAAVPTTTTMSTLPPTTSTVTTTTAFNAPSATSTFHPTTMTSKKTSSAKPSTTSTVPTSTTPTTDPHTTPVNPAASLPWRQPGRPPHMRDSMFEGVDLSPELPPELSQAKVTAIPTPARPDSGVTMSIGMPKPEEVPPPVQPIQGFRIGGVLLPSSAQELSSSQNYQDDQVQQEALTPTVQNTPGTPQSSGEQVSQAGATSSNSDRRFLATLFGSVPQLGRQLHSKTPQNDTSSSRTGSSASVSSQNDSNSDSSAHVGESSLTVGSQSGQRGLSQVFGGSGRIRGLFQGRR